MLSFYITLPLTVHSRLFPQSLLKPNAYIVTQGPNERTLNDFWRMMWKERSPCIVMLTKTFDFIKVSSSASASLAVGVRV